MQHRSKGIYSHLVSEGLQSGDTIIRLDHRGRYRVDLVTSSRGHHKTVGKVSGEATLDDATSLAAHASWVDGWETGVVLVQTDDGYSQIGNVLRGRYRKGR